ncbi:hypothetical protein MWL25_11525 [Escherichia coli]|nr:hypothetical protein [Escherichia coli]
MKTQITFAALLPALASFIPLHAHASSTSEDEMIVTGNTAADTTDSAAGAGLKWFTEFGHLNRGDMLTSEQHRCHNEKKKFQRRV